MFGLVTQVTQGGGGVRKTDHDSRPVQKRRRDKINNIISKDIE